MARKRGGYYIQAFKYLRGAVLSIVISASVVNLERISSLNRANFLGLFRR